MLYVSLATLQLAELRFYASNHPLAQSEIALPASVIILIGIVGLAALSHLEHPRSPRPAPLIQAYLLLTLLLDAARLRTRWRLAGASEVQGLTVIAALQSASFASKFCLLIFESLPKESHIIPIDGVTYSPEEKAGFLSRSLLFWLNRLFVKGYRSKFTADDLYPIDRGLGSESLSEKAEAAWARTDSRRRRRLALALVKAFWWQVVMIQLPRLALVGFAIAQPFLINAALRYVANHAILPVEFGYGLVGAFGLVYAGVAVSLTLQFLR